MTTEERKLTYPPSQPSGEPSKVPEGGTPPKVPEGETPPKVPEGENR